MGANIRKCNSPPDPVDSLILLPIQEMPKAKQQNTSKQWLQGRVPTIKEHEEEEMKQIDQEFKEIKQLEKARLLLMLFSQESARPYYSKSQSTIRKVWSPCQYRKSSGNAPLQGILKMKSERQLRSDQKISQKPTSRTKSVSFDKISIRSYKKRSNNQQKLQF